MKVMVLLGLLLGAAEADRPSPDAGPMLPSGTQEASTPPPITDALGAPEAPGSKALTPPNGKQLPPEVDEKTNLQVPTPDKTTAPRPPQGGGAKRTEDIKPGPNGTPERAKPEAKPPAAPDPDPRHTP